MRRRDFVRMIEAAGWAFEREGAEHTLYRKLSRRFAVPRHGEIRDGIVRAWRREDKKADEEEQS